MTNWIKSILEHARQIKENLSDLVKDIFLALIIILVGVISFGLGRLSAMEEQRPAIQLIQKTSIDDIVPINIGGMVVASKNGSKYHFPWCSGALRMSDKNKVWFKSIEEAEKAGYKPAGNCKGL